MRGRRPANDNEAPLRAVDPDWANTELFKKLRTMSLEEIEAVFREVGVEFPAKARTGSATTTRRQALATVAAAAVVAALPIAVVPEPPDAIDGLARDFMRDNPLLSYEKARELAWTV